MLNLDNLESIIQSKVDALGPTATEKDLLLLSKAIESAVGNITVSKICTKGAVALVDIEQARQATIADVGAAGTTEVGKVNAAGAQKIAAIGALDAVPKSGGTMTGPLGATDITADAVAADEVHATTATIDNVQATSVTATDVHATTVTTNQLQAAGATLTGALNGTTINSSATNTGVMTAEAASPSIRWRESDGPADGKLWDANVENQVLAFRIWNEAVSAFTSFLKFVRSGVASIYVLFLTAVRAQVVPLTDGPTITANFNAGNVFSVTLGGNRTLANPLNVTTDHQGGSIIIRQDGSGNRQLSFGSAWKFNNGIIPPLSTAANAVDRLTYSVVSPTEIHCSLLKEFR
ncbi:hypothetical protein ACHMW5_35790 (plasmid) [Azospirillum melinis]|uniref:hypothetical protein n=1 Tax=Azospirillum melinis TaxID=328839 RepID=UPI00375707CE